MMSALVLTLLAAGDGIEWLDSAEEALRRSRRSGQMILVLESPCD